MSFLSSSTLAKSVLACITTIVVSVSFASEKENPVVYVTQSPVPFSEDSRIAANIKDECNLGEKLANFILAYGEDYDVPIKFESDKDIPANAVKLTVEITEAVAGGNAFVGHRKYVSIRGQIEGGSNMGFESMRVSGGGAFGGFKGNCAVLGRTTKALGKDIAKWLRKPKDGAQLGDL